ncbi:MAG: hypothetical protein ABL940_06335 [Bacteroidia bacterium]
MFEEGKFNKALLILIYASIFVYAKTLFTSPFEFYIGYFAYILLLPIFILRHSFPRIFVFAFTFLFFYGWFHVVNGNNTWAYFLKIFLGVSLSYLFYYYVIVEANYNVQRLFELYLKGVYIVSIIGLIQFVSFKLNFSLGYDYTYVFNKWGVIKGGAFGIRLNSIFMEPTHFATFCSSGVFVAIYSLFVKPFYYSYKQCILVIIPYFLSFSGMGYWGIIIMLFLLAINFGFVKSAVFGLPFIIITYIYLYNNVYEFRDRIDGLTEVYETNEYEIGRTHGSAINLYDNYNVAKRNFSEHWLGTGLGSHPIAFDKYSMAKKIKIGGFANNAKDANSMFLRLMSETGIIGIAAALFLIINFFVIRRPNATEIDETYWIISSALLVMIILNLLRQGHYFLFGFPFFVLLYAYNSINYREKYKI